MNLPPDQSVMKIQILQEEARRAEELCVRYILYRVITYRNTYYAVEISAGEESEMSTIGHHYERAQRIFEILINETVTPCTLAEILRDVEICEEERRHCQNLCKI